MRFGGDAASVILILTDGVISDQANASVQVPYKSVRDVPTNLKNNLFS